MKLTIKKICIIIPAYNEEERIGKTLEKYCNYFKGINKKYFYLEILVVCNACKDNTLGIVKGKKVGNNEISYLNLKEGGKGLAIIEGFKEALRKKFDLIGFTDADMATPPEAFHDLIKKINGNYGVIASRWEKNSIIKTEQTAMRRFVSRVFNFLIRTMFLLPYKDTQCGAKLFRREALEEIIDELGITKWAFDVDLLYRLKQKNFKIIEVPTIWEDKKGSKIKLLKSPFQMFSAITRLRLLNSPFSFIVRLYDKIPENWKVHNW